MTFEAYIQGLFPMTIPSATLASIMLNRGIAALSETDTLTAKEQRLAYADICMYFAKSPSQFSGVKDSDNGWSHSEGSSSFTASDKAAYRKEANSIYAEYSDPLYTSGLKIRSLNGTAYYHDY